MRMALDTARNDPLIIPLTMARGSCDHKLGGVVRWYLLQTEPNRAFEALRAVASIPGIKPWLATEVARRVVLRNGRPVMVNGQRKREEVLKPLFGSYMFAAFDAYGDAWAPLLRRNREFCTVRLFTDTAFRPIPLPVGDVEAIQARGRAGDGAIDLEAPAFPPLPLGAPVRLTDSPFTEIGKVVRATEAGRVEILFGRLRVTAARDRVEAA